MIGQEHELHHDEIKNKKGESVCDLDAIVACWAKTYPLTIYVSFSEAERHINKLLILFESPMTNEIYEKKYETSDRVKTNLITDVEYDIDGHEQQLTVCYWMLADAASVRARGEKTEEEDLLKDLQALRIAKKKRKEKANKKSDLKQQTSSKKTGEIQKCQGEEQKG